MLDQTIQTQLKAYLERLVQPIELVASLDDSAKSVEMHQLLLDIASLSTRVTVRDDGNDARKPSFSIPMGHEFTSLVLALLQTGGHPPKLDAAVMEQIRNLPGSFRFETFFSLSCHNCPELVQALNTMSVLNPNIESVCIDGALFQDEVSRREIMGVPTSFLNGQAFSSGRMSVEEILAKVDTGAVERAAVQLSQKAPFDVLVVGGGASAPVWWPTALVVR
jgi:alkyl hydroperoxide reductase subunit F